MEHIEESNPTPAVKPTRKLLKSKKFAGTETSPEELVKKPVVKAKGKAKAKKGKAKAKKGKATVEKAKPAPKKTKAPKLSKAEQAEKAIKEVGKTDVVLKTNIAPSIELNTELQTAFDHFNRTLFSGNLAPVMFSNVRLKKALGHHWPASWARRKELKGKIDEIGLDFSRLREEHKGDKEVLSTLVHEMCHQQVSMTGKRERGHGHMWCAAMRLVGLEPIILDSKGVPTGKATGPNSSHSIEEGGAFDKAADELLKTGFKFSWFNEKMPEPEKKPTKKKKAGAKAKHTCPHCSANAWGKPSMILTCTGDKDSRHDPVEMDCDRGEYEGSEENEE